MGSRYPAIIDCSLKYLICRLTGFSKTPNLKYPISFNVFYLKLYFYNVFVRYIITIIVSTISSYFFTFKIAHIFFRLRSTCSFVITFLIHSTILWIYLSLNCYVYNNILIDDQITQCASSWRQAG